MDKQAYEKGWDDGRNGRYNNPYRTGREISGYEEGHYAALRYKREQSIFIDDYDQ